MIRLICRGRVARRKFPTRCTAAAAAAAAVSLVKYKWFNDAYSDQLYTCLLYFGTTNVTHGA
eukprot:COSAG06_NODE_32812_length_500_cov_0.571072_2_plen_61_part_01